MVSCVYVCECVCVGSIRHSQLTHRIVPRADVVIFLTSVGRPFSDSEGTFLREVGVRVCVRVCVCVRACVRVCVCVCVWAALVALWVVLTMTLLRACAKHV
jgi:hypothetical protein